MTAAMLSIPYSSAPSLPSVAWRRGARMEDLDPLIERAQRGDEAAFREIFVRHREVVARIVQRFVGRTADLPDIVQDVFIHVHRSIGSFRGDAKFSTWLYRLTANVSKMYLRRQRSRPRLVDARVPERSEGEPDGATPDAAVARQRRVSALYRLLDRLSEKKRTVLVLHDLEGLAAKEIAEIVDAPILTVRTRLFYARKELYRALAEEPALREIADALLRELPGKPAESTEPTTVSEPAPRRTRRRSEGSP